MSDVDDRMAAASHLHRQTAAVAESGLRVRMVLLLIETAAGFALFKVLKEKRLREAKVRKAVVPGSDE